MENKRSKSKTYGVAAIIALILVLFEITVLTVNAQVDETFLIKLSTWEVQFGTVFPQEILNKQLTVSFDDSFYQQNEATTVEYRLIEQLKPLPTGGYYPDLCPFLDEEVDGQPYSPGQTESLILTNDESDLVKVKLTVPCFKGKCELGYVGPVLDPSLNDKTFGCDLWVEVTSIY